MSKKVYDIFNFPTGRQFGKLYWRRTKYGIVPIFTRIEQTTLEEFME